MNNFLSKIKIKKPGSDRLPSKKSMNLYVKVKDGNSWQVIVPLAVFLAAVVFGIYKLGVVNRLNKLNTLRQENSQLSAELDAINKKLDEYPELEEEYRRYTASYLQPDEQGLVSRERIFDMISDSADGIGTVTSENIESNSVGMTVDIASLEDIELIQERLNDMDNIDEISVSTARGTNNVDVEGYMVFTVKRDTDTASQQAAGLSEDDKNAKIAAFSEAAEAARSAAEQQLKSAAASVSSAVSGGSTAGGGSSNAGSNFGSAQSGGSQSSGQTSAGSQSTAAPPTQNIGVDEVMVLPEGVSPFGFDSLEDGQKQLQEAGQ